ncbi:hypothetical protein tb265_05020 [Gemmatimonadetes bacterium T265]|nr:hypothetical protein tb265_05020 [Gemmatimonadetes bacterium T265]
MRFVPRSAFVAALSVAALWVAAAACASDRVTSVPTRATTARVPSPTLVMQTGDDRPTAGDCPAACERRRARDRARLERAAAGLTYMSESDYAFDFVIAPRRVPPHATLDEAAFRAAFDVAPDEPVEVVSLDSFFARHIEQVDPADEWARALVPRYRALKRTVHAVTGTTRVYRVGRIAVRCYLVGTDAWGGLLGLTTTAIET